MILQQLAHVVSLGFACLITCASFSTCRGMKTCDPTVQGRQEELGSDRWLYPAKQAAQLPSHCRGEGAMLWHPRLAGSSAVIPVCLTSHRDIATALFCSGKDSSLCLGQSVIQHHRGQIPQCCQLSLQECLLSWSLRFLMTILGSR